MPECRACKMPIRWAKTERGKPMPLDEKPESRAVVVQPETVDELRERAEKLGLGVREGEMLWVDDGAGFMGFDPHHPDDGEPGGADVLVGMMEVGRG